MDIIDRDVGSFKSSDSEAVGISGYYTFWLKNYWILRFLAWLFPGYISISGLNYFCIRKSLVDIKFGFKILPYR